MSIDLKRFEKLKRQVNELKTEVDKAEGAIEQLMVRLENEFECGSLKQAVKLLTNLEREEERLTKEYEEAVKAFEEDWKILSVVYDS